MFDTINGLPVHPLVVHGVVVLLPLAVIGTLALAVRPAWRRPYGPLVLGITAVATALIPVATASGDALEDRVGSPGVHEDLGEQLLWFAVPLLVLNLALAVLTRWPASATTRPGSRRLVTVVAVLSVVAALAAGVQVYRVGDSGAQSVWGSTTG
ncbi:hypothetical protein FNH13_14590 [Ornithinimicrobium ciconiae]|uniref:DUF2231 domain-containing protein n=1 Tax=Ornithinimicrobium ciconiae TaxID=2594265 RepID=A0A516GD02_9MICO|nr:DUF2231 domain-containing protein [Ornithinimicrobium ciconiae]QDO89404.1 hypothetical protein FNH13_14590 [Ornithinimicrobium ciconiae]